MCAIQHATAFSKRKFVKDQRNPRLYVTSDLAKLGLPTQVKILELLKDFTSMTFLNKVI